MGGLSIVLSNESEFFREGNKDFDFSYLKVMKVRASVKKMCAHCKVVKRRRVLFVICSVKKHKQRQG